MLLKTLLIINTALCLFRGAGFIFAPAKLWKGFNITLEKNTAFPVQLLGAAYIAAALMNWTAINYINQPANQSVIIFNFTIELIGAILTAMAVSTKIISKLGWLPFVIHLLLAVGFGYFLLEL